MFSEIDKLCILNKIEQKLLQIELEENNGQSNLQEVDNIFTRNPQYSSTFSEWEDDPELNDLITKKR